MASETLDQLWPGHKEKYNELNKSLIRTTISIPRIENSMEREETIRRAQRRIGEIEELLEIMRADLRSVPPRMPQWRSHFMSEYREFTDNFKQNKQEFELALTKHRFMDMNPIEREQRQRLLMNNNLHDSISTKSRNALQLIESTTQVAEETSGILYTQGETFDAIHSDLKEVNALNDRARRLLISMRRRMMTDRILQVFIVFIELVIIAIIVWYKWIRE